MKTAAWTQIEKEFVEWDNATYSNASQREIMDWFEIKFTEREQKWKELYKAQNKLIKLFWMAIYRNYSLVGQLELEKQITALEKELGLNKDKNENKTQRI